MQLLLDSMGIQASLKKIVSGDVVFLEPSFSYPACPVRASLRVVPHLRVLVPFVSDCLTRKKEREPLLRFVETISAYSTNDEATRRFLRESVRGFYNLQKLNKEYHVQSNVD